MHKSYQPTLPSANRLLQKKWDDKYYSEHRLLVGSISLYFNFHSKTFVDALFYVRDARPSIDTRPPRTYMHLHLKLKKLQVSNRFVWKNRNVISFFLRFFQLEEERSATIERDNRILLEKMSNIMRTTGRIDNRNDYVSKR